jgi:D-alanyl-D-alanine carboxypeptidase (penicillin-binding protein 5/6)
MRVLDTKQIYAYRRKINRKKKVVRSGFVAASLAVLLVGYAYIAYQKPLPDVAVIASNYPNTKVTNPKLVWPRYGQAAIGTKEYGLLNVNGDQVATPTASVAKIMTALSVLKQKPVEKGQQGPTITLSEDDVALHDYYSSIDGSVVQVTNGEQISEYQALEAMLLPSANNMAESLGRWAFGSTDAYLTYANGLAAQLGMSKSHFADASGFSPNTVSTASDLVKLGIAAMNEPVLAEIVGKNQASVPVVGTVYNTNFQLGHDGVVGIKTGNTDQAGGCYLFAAEHTYAGNKKVTVIGAIMSAPTIGTAIKDSGPLFQSAYNGFGDIKVVKKGQDMGRYHFAWGGDNLAVAKEDLTVFGWLGTSLGPNVSLEPIPSKLAAGSSVGTLTIESKLDRKSGSIIIKESNTSPSWWWRMTHV